MYICICNGITDRQIREAVKDGAHSLGCLQSRLGVATQCGKCAHTAGACMREESRVSREQESVASPRVVFQLEQKLPA